jgi:hypothetical protein
MSSRASHAQPRTGTTGHRAGKGPPDHARVESRDVPVEAALFSN